SEKNNFPLPKNGSRFLRELIGEGRVLADATLTDLVAKVPTSRLPDNRLINKNAEIRVLHARRQSLPDWLDMRSGYVYVFPDAVAEPSTSDEVQELLAWAQENGAIVIL